MKKKIIYSILAALFITACTNDEVLVQEEEQVAPGKEVLITVGMPEENNNSRISYTDTENSQQGLLKWEEGDGLSVVGYSGNTNVGETTFTLVENSISADGKSALFKGTLPTGDGILTYVVYYNASKLDLSGNKDAVSVDYSGQTQDISATDRYTAHLKNYLYLKSSDLNKQDFDTSSLSLELQNCIMEFDIKSLPNIGNLQKIYWECIGSKTKIMDLTFNGTWSGSLTGSAYVCFNPSDMALAPNDKIKVTLEGSTASLESSATSNGIDYTSSHRFYINIQASGTATGATLAQWKVPTNPNNEIWIKTQSNEKPNLTLPLPDGVTLLPEVNRSGYWVMKQTADFTSIADEQFSSNRDIIEVKLPSTIKTIGKKAFDYCTNLKEISIPAKVTTISDFTFRDCWNLKGITIPAEVTSIGSNAFENCKILEQINIPSLVTTIGQGAFNNTSIKKINIPSSVTTIGNYAFKNCKKLQTVHYDGKSQITSIARSTFENCEILSEVILPSSLEDIGMTAFINCKALMKITLPSEKLRSIGVTTFSNSGLTSVTIPEKVTTIGNAAFKTSSLKSVTIKTPYSTIKSFDYRAFTSVTDATLTLDSSWSGQPNGPRGATPVEWLSGTWSTVNYSSNSVNIP